MNFVGPCGVEECMVIVTVVVLLSLAIGFPIQSASEETNALRISADIPAPDTQKYVKIRDARDWRNPYLIVLKDGVDVRANGFRGTVPVSELRRVLVRLPLAAWPYGRVVAVQEMSLRAVGGVDDAPIKANVETIVVALKALDVRVNHWPMA